MSIKPDWWIKEQALRGMIEPFEDRLVRQSEQTKVISFGLSSFGYDLRAATEWRIFVNAFNTIVDPKNFDTTSFVEHEGETCIIPPNSFVLTRSVEYMRIPEDIMVVALGKSSYARCFRGDTRVALVNGTSVTLEDMAERTEKGEVFFGYSVGPHGRIIVTHLHAPRYIGRDSLLEIVLDNNKVIHCTPDHLFMTRDGNMVEASSLKQNASLMPLYRNLFRGYEMVYQPLTGNHFPTHRLADEWNLRNNIYEDVPDTHRHHIDHNRQNNMPWNITRMNSSEHISYHNTYTYGKGFDPVEHSESIKAAYSRLRKDKNWFKQHKESQQKKALDFWHSKAHAEVRKRVLEKRHAFWQTHQAREAQAERQKQFWENNDEARALQGKKSREAWMQSSELRRSNQQEIARQIRLRKDIDVEAVRTALNATGSIRGAARLLNCDRSVFRRFPDIIKAFKGQKSTKNHKVKSIRELQGDHDVYCLTVPEAGNFALEAGVFVKNCGIVANVTPLEPMWHGHVTLELSNTTPLPAKVYANEGIVQLLFFQGDKPEVTYADRQGKYQGQKGVTLPKL